MKNNHFILATLAAVAAFLLLAVVEVGRKRRIVGFSFPTSITKQYYTIPKRDERYLKCRYEVTAAVYGTTIVELLNSRMRLIQSDEATYQFETRLGRERGNTNFETVYHAALRSLQMEGILTRSDVDLCMTPPAEETPETTVEPDPDPTMTGDGGNGDGTV